MPNLYSISIKNESTANTLTEGEQFSVIYHNIFDFPLNFRDIIKWKATDKATPTDTQVCIKDGFCFVEGREGLVYKSLLRKRTSSKKLEIAKKAAEILSYLPQVRMIALTGSLAMENAVPDGDIDFLIITEKKRLWITRLLTLAALTIFKIPLRKSNDKNQKDKICLNMWMDESDLVWKTGRNFYTAHEIAQIVPIVNKTGAYENFLYKNRWILNYWPNAARCKRLVISHKRLEKNLLANYYSLITSQFEKVAYAIQYQHMKSRITRETVTPTRALFHPQDWGRVVLTRLSS